jgi:hypothetical protein
VPTLWRRHSRSRCCRFQRVRPCRVHSETSCPPPPSGGEKANSVDLPSLLRARRERPRNRAAEQRDELASFPVMEMHGYASRGRRAGYTGGRDRSVGHCVLARSWRRPADDRACSRRRGRRAPDRWSIAAAGRRSLLPPEPCGLTDGNASRWAPIVATGEGRWVGARRRTLRRARGAITRSGLSISMGIKHLAFGAPAWVTKWVTINGLSRP